MKTDFLKKTTVKVLTISVLALITTVFSLQAQENTLSISGTVVDSETRRPMVFASVSIQDIGISIVTNGEGFFTLKFPREYENKSISISYLGYHTGVMPISHFLSSSRPLTIGLIQAALPIPMTTVRPLDPLSLVKQAFHSIPKNFPQEKMQMTGFYREMIRKGNTYVTLSEAVIDVQKPPYSPSFAVDQVGIYKGRGSIDWTRIDTVFVKFQGGIRSALDIDVAKNLFMGVKEPEVEQYYDFNLEHPVQMNDRINYVISFVQKPYAEDILFRGKVYIDVETMAIARVEFNMNVENKEQAAGIFIRRKPAGLRARVEYAAYLVQYRQLADGDWVFDYSRTDLKFNAKWDRRLFSQNYTITSEMAMTEYSRDAYRIPQQSRVKTSDITLYRVADFEDPGFWEDYNIIEPESSIESVISRIIRQLRRRKR
ncbi:MAG: carboxypeptidase-like regulatory domain-containing protein [Bacteroidales bacterium]|nr:carboxypeptidase-like regulatory domain-containing protein [Bacteroidales bacterium]